MPKFTYTGDEGRYYPDLGRVLQAGDVVECDVPPDDGRFTAAKATPLIKAAAVASTTADGSQ